MRPTEFIATLRKGKPSPAYFLRGPDRFLQEECRAAIVAALPIEAREWCLMEIEYEPGRLGHELEGASQMPMLGGHSYFVFSDPEDFKRVPEEDYEALEAYLGRPSPFATVVFIAVEPDRRRRFVQLLEKKAEVVDVLPLSAHESVRWLEGYLQRAGVEIAPQLAEEIVARFESTPNSAGEGKRAGVNLLWLRTEIEKLLTARPEAKRLEREDLELMVAFREEHEIGKLLGAVAERKFPQALGQLRALLASKEPEMLILWCIGDLFRQALKATARGPAGRGGSRFAARGWGRVNPFSTDQMASRALAAYSSKELQQALRAVRRADLGIKSSWKDSRLLLESLLWEIITGKDAETVQDLAEPWPAQGAEA
jgi:DNA polymerase III delta subunit